MSKTQPIKCPNCGHPQDIDHASLQANRVIYRGKPKDESYYVTCKNCDNRIVIEIEVEETDD